MDGLAALRLQIEWGADEALGDAPVDRYGLAEPAALRTAPAPAGPAAPASAAPVIGAMAVERARAAATAADSLAALERMLAAFDGCGLAATAGKLVFGDGDPAGTLMLIGDCPGDEEDRAGTPFVGPAGQLLGRMIASIGLERGRCRLANVVPWRPPGNRPPNEAEIAVCLPFLYRHVALVAPRRVVLLGTLATRALIGGVTMPSRLRGRWHDVVIPGLAGTVPALPMAHPLGLMKAPRGKREAWVDLLQLRRALDADGADMTRT